MNRCASIAIENDDNVECDHSFTVEVGDIDCDTDPAIVSASTSATVTIVDDDGNTIFAGICREKTSFFCFCLHYLLLYVFPEITISMKDGSLIVDEGIAAGSQDLCVVVDIPSGGEVECALTVTVSPVAGTASMCAIIVSQQLLLLHCGVAFSLTSCKSVVEDSEGIYTSRRSTWT